MNYSICLDPTSFPSANLSANGFAIYTDADNFTTPISTNNLSSLFFPPPGGTCPYLVTGIPMTATQILVVDQCNTLPNSIASIFSPANIAAGTIVIDCCYALIDIDPVCIDLCDDCDLAFDVISLQTTGSIIAGNLTSTCGTITGYTIGWYLNGDYSAPQFTSGFGTTFPGGGQIQYQNIHPLTGNQSVPVVEGNWEGFIHDIVLNGTTYSSVSGSGNGINIPFQNCFGVIVAKPFSCLNGPFPLPYTHQKTFNAAANGVPPSPTSLTYELDPTVKHFAYQFKGFSIYDTLEIKWISGDPANTDNPSLYQNPIYLENIHVGSNAPIATNISSTTSNTLINGTYNWTGPSSPSIPFGTPIQWTNGISNIWPKSSLYSAFFKRVLDLTGLYTSSNPLMPDKLEIKITPNAANNSTNWVLGMQCLSDFDCTNCLFDEDPPFEISQIILERPTGNPCLQQRLNPQWQACPIVTSSLFTYGQAWYNGSGGNLSPIYPNYHPITGSVICSIQNAASYSTTCDFPSSGGTITFDKNNNLANGLAPSGQALGQIVMTFTDINDYNDYKNGLANVENLFSLAIGPINYNCNSEAYYAMFRLVVPKSSNPNFQCGDNTNPKSYYFHRNAFPNIVYQGATAPYSITIPMPHINDCLTFPYACTDCVGPSNKYNGSSNSVIKSVNNSSYLQAASNIDSFTTNTGAKYTQPWAGYYFQESTIPDYSGSVSAGWYGYSTSVSRYSMETVPFIPAPGSTTGWINLPNLSGSACPSGSSGYWRNRLPINTGDAAVGAVSNGYYMYYKYTFDYLTASLSQLSLNDDFKIYSQVINNSGSLYPGSAGTGSLIYQYSSSVITIPDPKYFPPGGPNLIIQPF